MNSIHFQVDHQAVSKYIEMQTAGPLLIESPRAEKMSVYRGTLGS